MDMAAAFAQIAGGFSAAFGGPYADAEIVDQAEVEYDDGGSIIASGAPVVRACQVQIDAATEAMRSADGFVDGDVRFLVLAATLDGGLGTDARVRVLSGSHAGTWIVSAITRDPVGVGFEGRGRRA